MGFNNQIGEIMNIGSIWDKLTKIDKMIIMSSLSWLQILPKDKDIIQYEDIFDNKEYNKIIFINTAIILYTLEREQNWNDGYNTKDKNNLTPEDPKEFHVSANNPDRAKRIIAIIKDEL